MADEDWITPKLLNSLIDEVDMHPSRIRHLNEFAKGKLYYDMDHSWVPVSDEEDANIDDRWPRSRENIINRSVKETCSVLLKNDPVVRTHPWRMEDSDLSDDMDDILLAAWRASRTRHTVRSMLKEACICGLSVGKVIWDTSNKVKHPDGEVNLIKLSPTMIRLDPYASNDERGIGCRYIIHTVRQLPEAILYRYGAEGATALGLRSARGRTGKSISKFLGMLKDQAVSAVKNVSGKPSEEEVLDRRVDVHEFWLFPLTSEESEVVIGEQVDEKRFPFGMVVTMIDDHIILRKGKKAMANPFVKRKKVMAGPGIAPGTKPIEVGHKLSPFVLLYWSREEDRGGMNGIYDCEGAVKQQIPMQVDMDALSRNIRQNATTTANPQTYYIDDALSLPEGNITLPPGGFIRVNSKYANRIDDVIRQPKPPALPNYVIEQYREKKMAIELQMGLKPGMVGMAPQGTSHTPMGTVGTLQEASFSSMWAPTDEIMACIEDIGIRYLGLIQQYYKPGRYADTSEQGETRFVEINDRHISANFRLEVVAGTTTPVFDLERETRMAEIKDRVDAAIASQNPAIMMSTVIYLVELRRPYAYQWIQLLQQQIQLLQQQQQGLQQIGAMGLQAGLGGQQGLPAQGGEQSADTAGIEALASEMGIPPDQLMQALAD
jgi:hypothetical protein